MSGNQQPPAKKAPGNPPPPVGGHDPRMGPISPPSYQQSAQQQRQQQAVPPTPIGTLQQQPLNVSTTAAGINNRTTTGGGGGGTPQRHPLLDQHHNNIPQPVSGALPPYTRDHTRIEEAQMAVSPMQRDEYEEEDEGRGDEMQVEMDKENDVDMVDPMVEQRRALNRTMIATTDPRIGRRDVSHQMEHDDETDFEQQHPLPPVPPYSTLTGTGVRGGGAGGQVLVTRGPPPPVDSSTDTRTVPSLFSSEALLNSPADPDSTQPMDPEHPRGAEGTEEEDDEDKYKPEGSVELKIERFSEFVRSTPLPGEHQVQRLSQPVYIRGLPWRILAIPRDNARGGGLEHRRMGQQAPKSLGYFLQCNGEAQDTTWNCSAAATLRIVSQKEGIEDSTKRINHTFYAKENDWGYSQFVGCETLLDPNNGFIKDDTIILSVDVSADAPHGVQWDSKKHAGHIGLKNQGATCYMNSILQTLFFTNKLRKAVYMMPTEEDDPDSSVALAMQRVFFELQFSNQPVGTKKLTKSFGWDSIDSFLQHDVQELCRVLLDNLESKMKQTVVADTIPQLFKGRTKSYIKCKNVDFESSREEAFYDVQLNVKDKKNVTESFADYTRPEMLDGENRYDAGEHGLQDAEKGIKFLSFPPVLHLQLMRFQYDPTLDANVKINDRFEFPDELQLNEFIDKEDGVQDDYTYLLHAVLVHSGDFHGGHYVVFINTNLKGPAPKWCKFDDDVVSRATHRDAVTANFGGEGDPEMVTKSYVNAYMLVYVKKNATSDVLAPVNVEDIPIHLKTRFEREKAKDAQRKKEKDEERLLCEVTMVTDEQMHPHHGFELFDAKAVESHFRKMRVEKSMTIRDLYKYVAVNLNLDMKSFRLWSFTGPERRREPMHFSVMSSMHHQQSECTRPQHLLPLEESLGHQQHGAHPQHHQNNNGSDDGMEENGDDRAYNDLSIPEAQLESDQMIYLEQSRPDRFGSRERRLPPFIPSRHRLCFVKFYHSERNLVEYRGPIFLDMTLSLNQHETEIGHLVDHPSASGAQIFNYFMECNPNQVVPYRPTANRPLGEDRNALAQNGSILVVELKEKATPDKNALTYFKQLYNRIEVEAHVHTEGHLNSSVNTPGPPVKGVLGLDWSFERVCQWLGTQIDYDYQKLALWKTNPHSEKPSQPVTQSDGVTLMEILTLNKGSYDPRPQRVYKLHYTKLPIRTAELDQRKVMKLMTLYEKFTLGEIVIFPEKTGTVQTLLDEAKKEFKFSESSTRVLRLVNVGAGQSNSRVYQIMKPEQQISEIYNRFNAQQISFRVEEVPEDQLEMKTGEHLMPVAHYDKELNRMFGIPFYIKISQDEPIRQIKQRIKAMLEVPDKEFEKYKFTIVHANRIARELEGDEGVVNLQELLITTHHPSAQSAPYLGIDHMNKTRGMRGGHTTEKAIVIHN